ncbi:MAG TPA: hypothetical protein VI076_14050 [Actinopolymorphaceae bacterium]
MPRDVSTAAWQEQADAIGVGVGDGLTTPPWRFDYILAPKGADVRHAWLISTDASDPLPLVADVVLS